MHYYTHSALAVKPRNRISDCFITLYRKQQIMKEKEGHYEVIISRETIQNFTTGQVLICSFLPGHRNTKITSSAW